MINISPNTDALLSFTLKTSAGALVSGATCTVDVINPLGATIISGASASMGAPGIYTLTILASATEVNGFGLRGVYTCIINTTYSGAVAQQHFYYEIR